MVHLHLHLLPRLILLTLTASAASQLVLPAAPSGSNHSQAIFQGGDREQQHEGKTMIKLSKRCRYVGTFFRMIDCNAPANSTIVPYRLVALPTAAAARKRGLKNERSGKQRGASLTGDDAT